MLTVNVRVFVKKENIQDFIDATIENASESMKEQGIIRFDLIQESDCPANFMLIEVYRDLKAPAAHKETDHYKKWRDSVAPMMAKPRTNIKYSSIFTKEGGYEL